VANRATSLQVPVRSADELRHPAAADWLQAYRVDLLLNVHSLHIIRSSALCAPRLGAYNLHPGPLPERAGLHVPSWAVYEGAACHGVTLHRMTEEVDAGPIAFADQFEVGERDTGLTVMMQCVGRGLNLIERLLAVAESGRSIPQHPQDPARRRWYGPGPPSDGRLDWHDPGRRIVDFVRACDYRPFRSPWGFPRCSAGDLDLAIVAATVAAGNSRAPAGTVVDADDGAVLVAAGDGVCVRVEKIEIDGQVMSPGGTLRHGTQLTRNGPPDIS
jgi:methionyl-tRNA formyltransferase